MILARKALSETHGARVFLRRGATAPADAPLLLGQLLVIAIVVALTAGTVHELLLWYGMSRRAAETARDGTSIALLFAIAAIVWARGRRRAIAVLTISDTSIDIGGRVIRSIPAGELATVQLFASPELEAVSLATKDRGTFVLDRRAWELPAIARELEECAVPRMKEDALHELADGAVLTFHQPKLWALERALLVSSVSRRSAVGPRR